MRSLSGVLAGDLAAGATCITQMSADCVFKNPKSDLRLYSEQITDNMLWQHKSHSTGQRRQPVYHVML